MSDSTIKTLNPKVEKAFKSYLLDTFQELTNSNMQFVDDFSLRDQSSHISKIEIETRCGTIKTILKIRFIENPNIVIKGASRQSTTAEVTREGGNWIAGRLRDDARSLGFKSSQSFPQTLSRELDKEETSPNSIVSEFVLKGAGVQLHFSFLIVTENETVLDDWPDPTIARDE